MLGRQALRGDAQAVAAVGPALCQAHKRDAPARIPGGPQRGRAYVADALDRQVAQACGLPEHRVCEDHQLARRVPAVHIQGRVRLHNALALGEGERLLEAAARRHGLQDDLGGAIDHKLGPLDHGAREVAPPQVDRWQRAAHGTAEA